MTSTRTVATVLGIWAIALCGAAYGSAGDTAVAMLHDREGAPIGRVEVHETANGALITVSLLAASPGPHAMHIHTTGRCDRPGFESAGDHYNPGNGQHGFLSPAGPHAGDLPNLHIPQEGPLTTELFAPWLRLTGPESALLDDDGAAVVLHAGRDDYTSQPAGDAGTPMACGVLNRLP